MRLLPLISLVLLVACSSERPADEVRAQRKAKKEAAAEAVLTQPPDVRQHQIKDGALVVIDVAVPDGYGGVERQKCFVWREPGIASMTCPSREVTLAP
jgi:hypothetical protein